jgi:hypothetical protein
LADRKDVKTLGGALPSAGTQDAGLRRIMGEIRGKRQAPLDLAGLPLPFTGLQVVR